MTLQDPVFGRHRRKIAPWGPTDHPGPDHPGPDHPGDGAAADRLASYARDKAAALNQHVIGYGALAENEWAALGIAAPDMAAARRHRLARIREQLRARDCAGVLLYDPLNVRYATDTTNMQLWVTHNAARSCFVATEGPVILFDFHNCEHLSDHVEIVDEVRPATHWFYFEAGERHEEMARRWAREIEALARAHGGRGSRLAIDRVNPEGAEALKDLGIDLANGEAVMELARAVKSPDELLAMRRAIAACEAAMGEMEAALRPGMTENDLWALLHAGNIRRGGEWIETRLLASGPRTNPWFQESSARVIEAGDLVAFDTDLIGPYGYCCDVSRTWACGEERPTNEQRALYSMAAEQIAANTEMLRPGARFRELSERAASLPPDCLPNRYSALFHGVGLCDEYPSVPYPEDFERHGYDGELEAGMVVCVESYVGRHGGHEGVKLEEQVLITGSGSETLSRYPLDRRLLGA